MKIVDVEVIVSSPGRNFVTVKVTTDDGIYGLGDGTLNGRELAVATYLEEYVKPCIIGRDPFDTEDIWHYLYRGVYWRKGAVNMTAIGAIDMALWDIKGKTLNVPVYKLLGGKSRNRLMAYAHAQGHDIDSTLQAIDNKVKEGYKAVRVQSGIPGLDKVYGVSKDKTYEPASHGERPVEEVWNTDKYLRFIPKLFQEIRKKFGEDLYLLHDAHYRLTPIEGVRLAKSLEPYNLFWLEDTLAAENQESLNLVRKQSHVPLAIGEVYNTLSDCQNLITNGSIDYLRMTIAHGGGITPMLKIASFAAVYHVKMGCHGPSDLSPINLAASIHFGTSINNFGIQESMGYDPLTLKVFHSEHEVRNGYFSVPQKPGLGVDMDFVMAKKYPYKKAFLPINRLEDGTLYHW